MTLDHIVIMNEVADNLEAVQKSMGTVEEYQATIDGLKELDETLRVTVSWGINVQDMDVTLNDAVEEDDGNLDDYMASLDQDLAEASGVTALPVAPKAQPVVEKKTEVEVETRERVAEMEQMLSVFLGVCSNSVIYLVAESGCFLESYSNYLEEDGCSCRTKEAN